MDKREKDKQRQQEDEALNRLVWWVAGSALLLILLIVAKRYRVNFTSEEAKLALGVLKTACVLTFVSLALAVAGAVLAVIRGRKGKSWGKLAGAAVFLAGLSGCSLAVWQEDSGIVSPYKIDLAVLVIVIVAVLAMAFYLYQRDFFVIAVTVAVDIVGVWLFSRVGQSGWRYLFLAMAVVLVVAVAVCLQYLRKSKGVVKVGAREVRIFPAKANYLLMTVSAALMVVVLIAAQFLMGGGIPTTVFYAVPVAWALIMAVYYTVKLM